MRRLALVPLLAIASLLPLNAAAVGLGSIEMNSALNQRLDAEIPLRGVGVDQADDVTVRLASDEAFRRADLPRPLFLTHLRFEVTERDGDLYVHATSTERITEPYVSFLIEVDAPSGSLLREYTVLLDPPVYATEEADPEVEPAAEPEPAPAVESEPEATEAPDEPEPAEAAVAETGEPAADEQPRRERHFGDEPVFLEVERERDRIAEEERRQAERLAMEAEQGQEAERTDRAAAEPALPESYTTRRGDTAWDIAARMAEGETSVQQMMLALLRHNPDAFVDDNVNRLRSGYVLRIPSQDDARSVEARTAIARIDRQNTLWREWRDEMTRTAAGRVEPDDDAPAEAAAAEPAEPDEPSDELRIVGAPEGGEVAAGDDAQASGAAEAEAELRLAREQLESTRMEKDELESRVGELESTVERMERLITVREEQLRALQERLVELADEEDIALEPDMFPDEELVPEDVAAAEADDEATIVDSDIVTTDDVAARVGEAAREREQELIAAAEETAADETAEADEAAAEQVAVDEAGEDDEDEAAVATVDDSGVETIRTQPDDEGWLARVLAPITGIFAAAGGMIAGGGAALPGGPPVMLAAVAAILGLIALLVVRRRQQAATDMETEFDADDAVVEGFDDLIGDELEAATAGDDITVDDSDLEGLATDEDPGMEETRPRETYPEEDPLAGLADDARTGEAGEPGAAEEPPKDDTIAEADVYLAYGLHQQARDLLTLALQESPRRADYHEKLLETLYSAGEKSEFEVQAARFHEVVDRENEGLWKRVVAMGREIAPENELFRQAGDPGFTASDIQPSRPARTDFELDSAEGGDTDLDFALDEESGRGAGDMESTQVDFGEPADSGETAVDFDQTVRLQPGDLEADSAGLADGLAGLTDADEDRSDDRTGDSSATGRDVDDGAVDEELEFDLGDLDDFDTGEPFANEHDEGGTEDDRAALAGTGASAGDDDAMEFDLSDLERSPAATSRGGTADEDTGGQDTADFDVDLEETVVAPGGSAGGDAAGVSPAEEDELTFDISDLEPAAAVASEEGATDHEATASAEVDLGWRDEPDAEDDETARGAAPAAAGEEEPAGVEFDLGELDDASTSTRPADQPDEAADTAGGAGGALSAMEETGEGDDELDTMLDLARAYIDMGDHDSATSALEEVIATGTETQREEAQKLLDSAR